jgi:acetyl-CoA synthetase
MEDTIIDFDSYDEIYRDFQIHVPKYYNFGFDVIDRWAEIDRNKLAMIWVNQEGLEKKFSFRDMKNLSNQAANILLKYGIQKGDRVMLMLPRIPEWWIFIVALIKLGAVVCPCPTMLTPKDIDYRLNVGKFKMIITNRENSAKVDEVVDGCPSLTCRFLVDGERPGWVSFPDELVYPAPVGQHADGKDAGD